MGAIGNLFPLLWFLAFLSPLAAIFFAVRFYAVHRRRRPEQGRHLPVVAYVVVLLVCAIIAFPFGMFFGVGAACTGPGASNLCGLFGVFVTGPFASSLAIFLVAGLVAALPADEPAQLPAGDAVSIPADTTRPDATTRWYRKLWRGEYSLGRSFWGFFVLGMVVGTILRLNPIFLFFPARLVFQPLFLAYQLIAGIGVWRSADAFAARRGGGAGLALSDSTKVIVAKAVVVLVIGAHALLLRRSLSIILPTS
jgi:hypothetical protein